MVPGKCLQSNFLHKAIKHQLAGNTRCVPEQRCLGTFGLSGVYGIPDSGCTAGSHPNEPLPQPTAGLAAVMAWVSQSGQPNLLKCLPGQDAL